MGKTTYKIIDLFAGIGGMRLAFESHGCECVFSSEINSFAQLTYEANFGEKPDGDITQISERDIPDHDILLAGFPCQPFSIAGVSKKKSLNRPHGFLDKAQGTLFFDIARILDSKRPRAFLLENVKNLVSHDKGKTFQTILGVLKDLGYTVYWKVIDAKGYVPQHRERIYIVGFSDNRTFRFPPQRKTDHRLGDILQHKVDIRYTLSDKLWKYLQAYADKHKLKGNGFGFGLFGKDDTTRTLSARYFKDGSEILVRQPTGRNPRRLTPRECARLMGFPDTFRIPVSDTQAYKQFGNAVAVPAVRAVARQIISCLEGKSSRRNVKPGKPVRQNIRYKEVDLPAA